MEFMESLYEIENFGIYLFIVIGLLVLAFLITLFFGSKDSKKNKKEEVKEEKKELTPNEALAESFKKDIEPIAPSVNTTEVAFKEESSPVPVNVEPPTKEEKNVVSFVPFDTPEDNITSPILNEVHEDDIKIPNDISFETPSEVKEKTNKTEVNVDKSFDFDALAAAISKDLDDIEESVHKKTEEPAAPVQPKVSRPEVFSSVYVDRSRETSPNTQSVPSMDFDLPKKVELPKTKE